MRNGYRVLLAISISLLLVSVFPVYTDASVEEKTGDIGYDSLSEEQQDVYDSFKEGIEERLQVISFSATGLTPDELQVIIYAYMSDHPENFWASYYTKYDFRTGKSVESTVDLDTVNIESMSAEINNAVSSFSVSGDSMPDRVKCIHNYIVDKASYQSDTRKYENCGNIYGALVEGKCKCDGYSLAMDYLCKKNGMKDIVVEIGKLKGETDGHAWNIIKMDNDKWYYIDVTGDDGGGHSTYYDYFLIGSKTDTPTGTFKDSREIYYDYHLEVSEDRYDYDPFGIMKFVPYIIAALVFILVFILLLYLLFRRHDAKVRSQNLANSQHYHICQQCGSTVMQGDRFCKQCGNMIAEKETERVSGTESEKKE